MAEDYEPTLEQQIQEHYKRQATLTLFLDWCHDFIKENGLEKAFWDWKVAKGYVKPEGGFALKETISSSEVKP